MTSTSSLAGSSLASYPSSRLRSTVTMPPCVSSLRLCPRLRLGLRNPTEAVSPCGLAAAREGLEGRRHFGGAVVAVRSAPFDHSRCRCLVHVASGCGPGEGAVACSAPGPAAFGLGTMVMTAQRAQVVGARWTVGEAFTMVEVAALGRLSASREGTHLVASSGVPG